MYLKTDFKLHLQDEDPCPDHCLHFAFSDESERDLQHQCSSHEHTMRCDRSCLFPDTVECIKKLILGLTDTPREEIAEMTTDLEFAEAKVKQWKSHLVRSVNQDKGRLNILENLQEDEAMLMKFLPISFREKQSDWFCQKGISWHVTVCVYKSDDKLKHRTFAHIMDSAKQDWYSVASILQHTLMTIKTQLPHIQLPHIRSDNAVCYHCSNSWFAIPRISEITDIMLKIGHQLPLRELQIKFAFQLDGFTMTYFTAKSTWIDRFDYSEAQNGKCYCDANIAHMRGKIKRSVSDGRNVLSAEDMKEAIDECGGIVGCQAAHVDIVPCESPVLSGPVKGISKLSNVHFQVDGSFKVWKAYEIGVGKNISPSMNNFVTSLSIRRDFTTPDIVEGTIKGRREGETSATSTTSFNCPKAGCVCMFESYLSMQEHCLTGQHSFQLEKISSYDYIRMRWQNTCMNLSESARHFKDAVLQPGPRTYNLERGWALKKDRKSIRFSQNVKSYLKDIFDAGERNGQKVNPATVAKNMRVCRDDSRQKRFQPDECLQQSQIASYFSRLSVLARNQSHSVEDVDLGCAVSLINKLEAMEMIEHNL